MAYAAGVDVGSTQTKAVIIDEQKKIVSRSLIDTGANVVQAAEKAFLLTLKDGNIREEEVSYVIGTGYGRYKVTFGNAQITEISCHGRGAVHMFPKTRTVIDMGGQDTKGISINESGEIIDFCMNDKCAAGTGTFLEKTARYMGYETDEIGPLVQTSKFQVPISGVCAVFAESEVINQLSLGSAPADIMHGAMFSLVKRAIQLLKRVRMEPRLTLTGGIMRFPTMIKVIKDELDEDIINVPEGDLVQYTTALGAATLANQRLTKLNKN